MQNHIILIGIIFMDTGQFFSNEANDFGVQQFKKGFNAHVEEFLIGDFIKPEDQMLFFLI